MVLATSYFFKKLPISSKIYTQFFILNFCWAILWSHGNVNTSLRHPWSLPFHLLIPKAFSRVLNQTKLVLLILFIKKTKFDGSEKHRRAKQCGPQGKFYWKANYFNLRRRISQIATLGIFFGTFFGKKNFVAFGAKFHHCENKTKAHNSGIFLEINSHFVTLSKTMVAFDEGLPLVAANLWPTQKRRTSAKKELTKN